MKSAVSALSARSMSQKTVDAMRQARSRSPRSRSSLKTGTNAAESAASATSARTRFGIWKATVNALIPAPSTPNSPRTTISRTRPRMRERPVASEKTAVDHASRERRLPSGPEAASAALPVTRPSSQERRAGMPLLPSRAPAERGHSYVMPNIKQQKKRVRTAARERLENLRYRSTVKTLTRRLESAVDDGDAGRVTTEHQALVRWIDKAAARGALHRNAAARKKSQAARLAGGSTSSS